MIIWRGVRDINSHKINTIKVSQEESMKAMNRDGGTQSSTQKKLMICILLWIHLIINVNKSKPIHIIMFPAARMLLQATRMLLRVSRMLHLILIGSLKKVNKKFSSLFLLKFSSILNLRRHSLIINLIIISFNNNMLCLLANSFLFKLLYYSQLFSILSKYHNNLPME